MEIFKEESIKSSYRFIIASISNYTNKATTTDDDAEILINTVLNILMNTLQPSYADMFLTELLYIIDDVKMNELFDKAEAFDIIQKAMKGKD